MQEEYLFVDKEFPKDLICGICKKLFKNPCITHCGHSFCTECMEGWITVRSNNGKEVAKCPECDSPLQQGKISSSYKIEAKLEELKVYCTHKEMGCEWEDKRKKLRHHLQNNCRYKNALQQSPKISRESSRKNINNLNKASLNRKSSLYGKRGASTTKRPVKEEVSEGGIDPNDKAQMRILLNDLEELVNKKVAEDRMQSEGVGWRLAEEERRRDKAEEECKLLNEKIVMLQEDIARQQQRHAQRLKEEQEAADSERAEKRKMRAEISRLSKKVEEGEESSKQGEKARALLKQESESWRQKHSEAEERIRFYEQKISSMSSDKLDKVEVHDGAEMAKKVENLERHISVLKAELASAKSEAEGEAQEWRKLVERARNELEKEREKMQALEEKCTSAESRAKSAEESLMEERDKFVAERAQLAAEIKLLCQAKEQESKNVNSSSQEELLKLQEKLSKVNEENDLLADKIAQLQDELDEVNKAYDLAMTKNDTRIVKIEQRLYAVIKTLKSEKEKQELEFRAQVDVLQEELESSKRDISNLVEKLQEKEKAFKMMILHLPNKEGQHIDFQQIRDDLISTRTRLEQKLQINRELEKNLQSRASEDFLLHTPADEDEKATEEKGEKKEMEGEKLGREGEKKTVKMKVMKKVKKIVKVSPSKKTALEAAGVALPGLPTPLKNTSSLTGSTLIPAPKSASSNIKSKSVIIKSQPSAKKVATVSKKPGSQVSKTKESSAKSTPTAPKEKTEILLPKGTSAAPVKESASRNSGGQKVSPATKEKQAEPSLKEKRPSEETTVTSPTGNPKEISPEEAASKEVSSSEVPPAAQQPEKRKSEESQDSNSLSNSDLSLKLAGVKESTPSLISPPSGTASMDSELNSKLKEKRNIVQAKWEQKAKENEFSKEKKEDTISETLKKSQALSKTKEKLIQVSSESSKKHVTWAEGIQKLKEKNAGEEVDKEVDYPESLVVTLLEIINLKLKEDVNLKNLLPFSTDANERQSFINACSTGTVLCKLLLTFIPKSLDEKHVQYQKGLTMNKWDRQVNVNLFFKSASMVGCDLSKLSKDEIVYGNPKAIIEACWQTIKAGYSRAVKLANKRGKQSVILEENEVAGAVLYWSTEQTLMRWVDFCFNNHGIKDRKLTSFSDLADCVGFACVLSTIDPSICNLEDFLNTEQSSRAPLIVEMLQKVGCPSLLTVDTINNTHQETCLLALAFLYSEKSSN